MAYVKTMILLMNINILKINIGYGWLLSARTGGYQPNGFELSICLTNFNVNDLNM